MTFMQELTNIMRRLSHLSEHQTIDSSKYKTTRPYTGWPKKLAHYVLYALT